MADKRLNVLVVENDWLVRASVMDMLDELGHVGTGVSTAAKAMSRLREATDIDLLLLDIGLPDMDGRELAKAARAVRPDLRIVFASGYGPERIREAAESLKAEYLAKPYLLDDLKKAMTGRQ